MDWTLPLDGTDFERATQLRKRFAACCAEIDGKGRNADAMSAAIAVHLASTVTADLPPSARPLWQERIVRALKADVEKPLPQRAIASVRSWPASRVGELYGVLAEIEALVDEALNEAHHEAIYTEISRAYS